MTAVKSYLRRNALKLVVAAAAFDLLYVVLRDFGYQLLDDSTILSYGAPLAGSVNLVGLLAGVFYWLATGAIVVLLYEIYQRGMGNSAERSRQG